MESLVNPHVLQITPYKPGKPVEDIQREFNLDKVIKLASNENMLPIPENVRRAIGDELSLVRFYPDSDNYYLRQRIAEYNGLLAQLAGMGAGWNPSATATRGEVAQMLFNLLTQLLAI